jgi:hypothetical protein
MLFVVVALSSCNLSHEDICSTFNGCYESVAVCVTDVAVLKISILQSLVSLVCH